MIIVLEICWNPRNILTAWCLHYVEIFNTSTLYHNPHFHDDQRPQIKFVKQLFKRQRYGQHVWKNKSSISFALKYLLLVFLAFLTFAFPHTSLVPSLSACSAVGFVPSMHCQLAHYLMHTMWTVEERVWEIAGDASACCLLNFLQCRDWLLRKLCLYLKEHILHWVAQGIKACGDKQRTSFDSTRLNKNTRRFFHAYKVQLVTEDIVNRKLNPHIGRIQFF